MPARSCGVGGEVVENARKMMRRPCKIWLYRELRGFRGSQANYSPEVGTLPAQELRYVQETCPDRVLMVGEREAPMSWCPGSRSTSSTNCNVFEGSLHRYFDVSIPPYDFLLTCFNQQKDGLSMFIPIAICVGQTVKRSLNLIQPLLVVKSLSQVTDVLLFCGDSGTRHRGPR